MPLSWLKITFYGAIMKYYYTFFYILLSFLALLFSRQYFSLVFIYILIAAIIIVSNQKKILASGFFQIVFLIFYPVLIIVSCLFHWYSLSCLPDLSYISLDIATNIAGIQWAKLEALRFLAFPLFYVILLSVLGRFDNPFRLLQLLPLLFIPSLCVGFYQEFIDHNFFNSHGMHSFASGLSFDASAYGLLILPLILITSYNIYHFRKKPILLIFNAIYLMSLFYALLLRGQKTTILCLGLFVVIYPLMWLCVNKFSRTAFKSILLLYSIPVILLFAFVEGRERNLVPDIKGLNQVYEMYQKTADNGYSGFVSSVAATRIRLWRIAGHIIDESPWAGFGPGGHWRVMKNFERKYNLPKAPKDSAANHYLHMTIEVGFVGLFVGLIPFIFCYYRKNYIYSKSQLAFLFSINLLILFSLISGPHMNSPDVAFVFSIFPALLVAGSSERRTFVSLKYALSIILLCVFCVFILKTYQNSIGKKGYASMRNSEWFPLELKSSYGFYNWEDWDGIYTRWMQKKGGFTQKVRYPYLQFNLTFPPYPTEQFPDGIQLEIIMNGIHLDSIKSISGEEKKCTYFLPDEVGGNVEFSFHVNQTYNPAKYFMSRDDRELGVAFSDFQYFKAISAGKKRDLLNNALATDKPSGGCL